MSKQTLGEAFDVDITEEREKRMQEQLDDVRFQQKIQVEVQKLQNNLASQVQAQAAMGQQGLAYDQQQMIAQADQMVQQLSQLDPGTRRSQMDALKKEDLPMYSLVKERLHDQETAQNYDAISAARAGQPGQAPDGNNGTTGGGGMM